MSSFKIFYGWVIVAAGIVVTCIGVGAMLSLSVFLQPMTEATGWSRTGISMAAMVNWLWASVRSCGELCQTATALARSYSVAACCSVWAW